jgi:hypothetical protein
MGEMCEETLLTKFTIRVSLNSDKQRKRYTQHCYFSGLHPPLNSKMKTTFQELALLPSSSGKNAYFPVSVERANINPCKWKQSQTLKLIVLILELNDR